MTSLPILLPPDFTSVVKENDSVTVGQLLAQKNVQSEEIVNIPTELDISLSKVKKVLKKNPGDKVQVGDVIAVKKNFFGQEQAAIISKVDGVVSRYERSNGSLAIATSNSSLTESILSPVDGRISLCDNKQIVLESDKEVILGTAASGESGEGEIFILEKSFSGEDSESILFHLDSEAIGKIIVGGKLTKEVLLKGIGIGVVGIVATDIDTKDIAYLAQKKIAVPVIVVDIEAIKKIIGSRDKKIFLNTHTKSILL